MSLVLSQRSFFTKRRFEITDKSLKILVHTLWNRLEDEYTFEEIGRKNTKSFHVNIILAVAQGIAVIVFFTALVEYFMGDKTINGDTFFGLLIVNVIILFYLLKSYCNNINLFLIDKRFLVFFANSPSKTAVQDFILNLKKAQKDYMISKYATRNSDISDERLMDQIIWIKEREIITDTEFQDLKKVLFNADRNNPIGFNFKSSYN